MFFGLSLVATLDLLSLITNCLRTLNCFDSLQMITYILAFRYTLLKESSSLSTAATNVTLCLSTALSTQTEQTPDVV